MAEIGLVNNKKLYEISTQISSLEKKILIGEVSLDVFLDTLESLLKEADRYESKASNADAKELIYRKTTAALDFCICNFYRKKLGLDREVYNRILLLLERIEKMIGSPHFLLISVKKRLQDYFGAEVLV